MPAMQGQVQNTYTNMLQEQGVCQLQNIFGWTGSQLLYTVTMLIDKDWYLIKKNKKIEILFIVNTEILS